MKILLVIALALVAIINQAANSLLEIRYQGINYVFPVSYLFLAIVVLCSLSWLLAYQWQSLKIYFYQWSLMRTKKELNTSQQKLNDYFFYFNFLDQHQQLQVFRALAQGKNTLSSLDQQTKQIAQTLVDRNQLELASLMKQLSRKMQPSVFKILETRVALTQLKQLEDHQQRLIKLKALSPIFWEQPMNVKELLDSLADWSPQEQSLVLKKIDPLILSVDEFFVLEALVRDDPQSWLIYFYEHNWHELVERSEDLALFLIKLNVHLEYVGQAQQLVERLPPSLIKGLLRSALTEPQSEMNKLLQLTQA